jgi:arginine exporter protein ArgO
LLRLLADIHLFQIERRAMKIKANDPQLRDISGAEDREIGGGRELERIIFFSDAVSFVNPAASLFTFVLLGPIRLVLTRIFEGRRLRPTKQEAS